MLEPWPAPNSTETVEPRSSFVDLLIPSNSRLLLQLSAAQRVAVACVDAGSFAFDGFDNGGGQLARDALPAIVDGDEVDVLPLEGLEEIEIDGSLYEAFNTSGGLGSLGETFRDKVTNMNYKTIRYPGHSEQILLLINGLKLNHDRDTLKRILENAVPQTLQDVVIVYAAVNGIQDGELREENYVNKVYPQMVAGRLWSAIQITTAAATMARVPARMCE